MVFINLCVNLIVTLSMAVFKIKVLLKKKNEIRLKKKKIEKYKCLY